jgi:hypothetical protein
MRAAMVLLAAAVVVANAPWTAGAAGTGNPRNDRLMALNAAQRAQALGAGLHRGCVGVEAFPMGVVTSGKAKGAAYWSVRCKDGKSYAVELPPNSKIPAMFVDCQQLQGTGHECFKKF